MPKTSLSDVGLRSLAPPPTGQLDYWDQSFKHGLFGCRVSQGGTKTFLIKHKNRRITIGRYPAISLSEARGEAKKLLAEFTLGRAANASPSFTQAVEEFLKEKARAKKARTVRDYKRLLGRLRFTDKVAEITHQEAGRQLNKFTSPSERAHILVAGKIFFNWCIKRRYCTDNPFSGLTANKTVTRSRTLTDKELKAVWTAAEKIGGHYGTIVRLLILTGQRKSEIASLQTSWIYNDTITLPKEITKNGREHTFPLSATAACILKKTNEASAAQLFFPARGQTTKPFNGWSKSKAALDKLSGVSDWTLHDLRRTFATNLAQLGIAPHVVERLLNHISGQISGVSAIYNRATYMPEMRAAIDLWETKVTSIVG